MSYGDTDQISYTLQLFLNFVDKVNKVRYAVDSRFTSACSRKNAADSYFGPIIFCV